MNTKYTSKELEEDYGYLCFADLLRIQREDEGYTQIKMAKKLGISKQKLCDFEKGRRVPSAKLASSWAKKLGHPEEVWLEIVLQDQSRADNLEFEVKLTG